MWMAAGFCMLEAGLVRSKNTVTICLKNVSIFAIAGIMYYLIGYNLMYVDVMEGGWVGSLGLFFNPSDMEIALMNAEPDQARNASRVVIYDQTAAGMAEWFFQMVFVATAASIVSGTLAERIKLWPFLIFVILLTGLIYPLQGAWTWGGGWLDALGFSDFAGSTIVHSVGGWAALTGAIILGPRSGKYGEDGKVHPMPGANLPLATLGTFILWMGWFGFNGGSVLALGSAQSATIMAIVFMNTNLAAAAGAMAAMAYSSLRYRKPDLTLVLNGALAGLVAITAGPDIAHPGIALVIGAIGGIAAIVFIPILDRFKIDDVVGAISVHLVAGIWGTLAVGLFSDVPIAAQAIGILAIGIFVCLLSSIFWLLLKFSFGLRVDDRTQRYGLDGEETGLEAYPDFVGRT
jgi:Amt family ammonium transporter